MVERWVCYKLPARRIKTIPCHSNSLYFEEEFSDIITDEVNSNIWKSRVYVVTDRGNITSYYSAVDKQQAKYLYPK
ncbi:Hypothetical predicted protein [Octopus vulgaris]|uniref:Uncharacterized protein n=1 Tax=Octopus vulgaris TaxID=6645 RepID=A0AA36AX56_OCTVU|nr:Hypothetical predicted protein [Octopus vulgaris]